MSNETINDELNVLQAISHDARAATKTFADIVFKSIWPLIITIRKKLQKAQISDENGTKALKDVFALSCSQIKKSVLILFEVFKLEHRQQVMLQDSRQCTIERLSWCMDRLESIHQILDKLNDSTISVKSEQDNSILATPMYFVNWIDQAFEILATLSTVVYRNDFKETDESHEAWKSDLIDSLSKLHVSLDELLLATMTLCKYCLPCDQHIVKTRCQVVLRETKMLLSELITGDLNAEFKITKETLKLPVVPSNVDVLIDVLKDVLYSLETNTNTALLALLVHCFSYSVSPVDLLKGHFLEGPKATCPCVGKEGGDIEDCLFVKEFDLYNERLLQIGTFAVSCSSDQNRILTLRSGLASLEALDPHLVPAIMLAPDGIHAQLLLNSWRREVQEIRDSVFLIVDPAAFAQKSKQMMHQKLLKLIESNGYDNAAICAVINVGSVLEDFFEVYKSLEPDALLEVLDKLTPLLLDLRKVQVECKIVSNLLSSDEDMKYDVKVRTNKGANFEQLLKRLKLLYTIVNRINSVFHSKDSDDHLFVDELCEEESLVKQQNVTHTILGNNGNTYVTSPPKAANISRSIFARTANVQSGNNFVLARLSKRCKVKRSEELSFSFQLDALLHDSNYETKNGDAPREVINKHLDKVRDITILYKYSPTKDRSSLRKAVLRRTYEGLREPSHTFAESLSENGALLDNNTSLQITEILDQMTDISNMLSSKTAGNTTTDVNVKRKRDQTPKKNILSLNINNPNTTISKHIWKIPVNATTVEMSLDDTVSTNMPNVSNASSQPSNISTLERLNDLDLLETRLDNLKLMQKETTL